MEHRGIEYQIKIGITKHEWRGPSAPHPPSKARLVALGMTPSTLLSEPSNNGATNTPMTANHQTDRPPQAGGLLIIRTARAIVFNFAQTRSPAIRYEPAFAMVSGGYQCIHLPSVERMWKKN
jgi:hypothetical protein